MAANTDAKRPLFLPPPLADDWSNWIVGEWEGTSESDTGQGKCVECIEFTLNGQFLICRSEARIPEISPEEADCLKRNLHATGEEIERFQRESYQTLQRFTIDQTTSEVVGCLFDSLRCVATGRGKREGNRETIEGEWGVGHISARITEGVRGDKIVVVQRPSCRMAA